MHEYIVQTEKSNSIDFCLFSSLLATSFVRFFFAKRINDNQFLAADVSAVQLATDAAGKQNLSRNFVVQ